MNRTPTIAACLAVIALITGAYAATATISQRHQISELETQLAAAHTTITRAESVITTQEAKLGGQHRDLITCADLAQLINYMPQTDSAGDTVFYGGPNGAIPLPAHCLNQ